VTKVTSSSRLRRLFHGDRSWKQDVVFKMNVLVQICFEFRQRLPFAFSEDFERYGDNEMVRRLESQPE
jgi:hypothetical protein